MDTPLTSIIVPTYNRAYIITRAINSVLAQTDQHWELIIIDDGSTDETEQLVAGFDDKRIRYIHQPNAGVAAARNYGLSQAQGTWIAYLDSDNELSPEYLATMHDRLRSHPKAVFALPRAHRVLELYKNNVLAETRDDNDDAQSRNITIRDIFMRTFHVDTNGFMHLQRLYGEGVRWDASLPVMEDWELALTIGNSYPKGFLFIDRVLVTYYQRFGGDGIRSNTSYADNIASFEAIYEKHKSDPLMQGETWYETALERWQQRQRDFLAGKLPAYSHFYLVADKPKS